MNKVKPIIKYDIKGNITYYRDSDGYEYWYEFDANGNEIHYRDSYGYEYWYEFDANRNRIHCRNNNGDEDWYWEGKRTKDPIKILLLQKRLRDKATSA